MVEVGVILQLIGGVMSAFFLILIITKKKLQIWDKVLAINFVVLALALFLSYTDYYNLKNGYPYPHLLKLAVPLVLLHAPLFFIYIKTVAQPKFRLRYVDVLHLTPFLFVFILMLVGFYTLTPKEKVALDNSPDLVNHWSFQAIFAAMVLTSIIYYTWGYQLVRQHSKNLSLFFSNTEVLELKWLRFMLVFSLVIFPPVDLLYMLNPILGIADYMLLQVISYVAATINIVVFGYFGIKQCNIFKESNLQDEPLLHEEKVAEIAAEMPQEVDVSFEATLLRYMQECKPYLNPDLSIPILAQEMNVSVTYLSNVINGKLKLNFNDFINMYRIEEFKKSCSLPQNRNYTLIGIAYDCGFNSKATFYRVFKNAVGVTPSQYYESANAKDAVSM
jgi:AraC-like DNA-binding protein